MYCGLSVGIPAWGTYEINEKINNDTDDKYFRTLSQLVFHNLEIEIERLTGNKQLNLR